MNFSERLPYPGLRAFTRDESDLFFGRDDCVNAMIDRLAATRFLAVLGPSGSGKSSLVRTGLLDALDLGLHPKAASGWKVAEMHPGGQPMRKLATSLLQTATGLAPGEANVDVLIAFLNQGPRALTEWVSYGNLPPGSNLLLLVDQFEELFRFGDYAQKEETEAFIGLLLESASSPSANIHVVITMRSEFLGACSSVAGLAERISDGLYLTPRMSREECRQAIEGPASVLGFTVEPVLVNRLLNDLASFAPWERPEETDLATLLSNQADQLPLMQHVLNRLWVRAEGGANGALVVLKLADYDQLGGLSGALDEHGMEVLASLGSSKMRAVENIFRALVSGTSLATAVRRPCLIGELIGLVESAGDSHDDVIAVVEAFRAQGCNFLRTTQPSLANDEVIVDISHESLIRQWTPLRQWLDKEVSDGAAWRRLIQREDLYRHHEGGLLGGLDLSTLTAWWESAHPTPAWTSRHGGRFEAAKSFLDASHKGEADRAEAERRKQLAEQRRLRLYVAGLAAGLVIFATLGILAGKNGQEAERKRKEAVIAKEQADENLQRAQKAEEKSKYDVSMTSGVLNYVSDLAYEDRYRNLVGITNLQSELMGKLAEYRSDLSQHHKEAVSPTSMVRDDYRLGLSFETSGGAQEALRSFGESYEAGRKAIRDLPLGQRPNEMLEVNWINDGYRYAWLLLDIGEIENGRRAIQEMVDLVDRYARQSTTARLLIAHSRLESLESRYYQDQHKRELAKRHSLAALDLSKRAMALPNPDIEAMAFEFQAYRNLALDSPKSDQDRFLSSACALADRMMTMSPMDRGSIGSRVECLKAQSDGLNDKSAAAAGYQEAEDLLDSALQMAPEDQELLLLRAKMENSLADNMDPSTAKDAVFKHRMAAKDAIVRALKGRTLFQSNPYQVENLYNRAKNVDFPNPVVELAFYKDSAEALTATLKAFPKAPSFAYVEADASIHIGQLLEKDPKRAKEAETYLTNAMAWFDRSGVIHDLTSYSENFTAYCGSYKQLAELYGTTGRAELMIAETNALRKTCQPALDKYPWDFYLRGNFYESARFAGKTLFELKRYRDSLPFLEYASHWGVGDSSGLLAQMYGKGLGVSKSEEKASQLEKLAADQSMKRFTIPTDFGGLKTPFYVYVRQWPPEYPFPGIDDQAKWVSEARGGTIPHEAVKAFEELDKIAREKKASFPELCVYALSTTDKIMGAWYDAQNKWKEEPTAANLAAKTTAGAKRYDELVKAQNQEDADEIDKQLADNANNLVTKTHNDAAYRLAWNIFLEQGDHLRTRDAKNSKEAAHYPFAQSLEMAEHLPGDNADDMFRRILSYERLGDQDSSAGRYDSAREWYSKEVEESRKRYKIDGRAESLGSLRLATIRLYNELVKLKQKEQAEAVSKSLVDSTESLLSRSQTDDTLHEAIRVYTGIADAEASGGDPAEAQRYVIRAEELAQKLSSDTPNGAFAKYLSLEATATTLVKLSAADDAKAAYFQASSSLRHYLDFVNATPQRRADGDKESVAGLYGGLSWVELLAGSFSKSMQDAQRGLDLDPGAMWVEANLAHALLLSGNQKEATEHYMNVRKGRLNDRSLLDATREDFVILKTLGFTNPAMDDILKQMASD